MPLKMGNSPQAAGIRGYNDSLETTGFAKFEGEMGHQDFLIR